MKVKGGDENLKETDVLSDEDFQINGEENKIIYKQKWYSYHHVLSPSVTQENVYSTECSDIVKQLFEGYNGTIFVYGGSGSGKTYTMIGPESWLKTLSNYAKAYTSSKDSKSTEILPKWEDSKFGIIIRCMEEIFDIISKSEKVKYEVAVGYFEIYMEDVYDLISKNKNEKLENKQKKSETFPISWSSISSMLEVYKFIETGQNRKKEFPTQENTRSSRSHTIFVWQLTSIDINGRK